MSEVNRLGTLSTFSWGDFSSAIHGFPIVVVGNGHHWHSAVGNLEWSQGVVVNPEGDHVDSLSVIGN
jgi:hypothetical protein